MNMRSSKWSKVNLSKYLILPLIVVVIAYKEMGAILVQVDLTLLVFTTFTLSISYWGYHLFRKQKIEKTALLAVSISVLCLSYFFGSLLWSSSQEYGLQKLMLLTPMLLIGLTSADIINKYSSFFALLIFISALIVVLKLLFQQELNLANQFFRLRTAEETNPIRLGSYMVFALFSISYLSKIYESKTINILTYITALIFFVVVILTGSKGPVLALILVSFITYILNNRIYKLLLIVPFLFLMFYMFGFATEYLPPEIEAFYNQRFNITAGQGADSSVSSRIDMIKYGFSNLDNMGIFGIIFGQGAGSFAANYSGALYPHNLFVELIFEYGILGFFLFCFFVLILFIYSMKYELLSQKKKYFYKVSVFYFLMSLSTGAISNIYLFVTLLLIYLKKED